MMTTANNGRPITDILRDLLAQITALMRNEGELARAEMSEKIDQTVRGMVFVVAGAVLLIPALVILLAAAVAAIMAAGIEPYWAALIVGGAALIVGLALVLGGKSSLGLRNLAPRRTMDHLRRDVSVARNQLRRT
ncbi:MAG TPA: phage holin family protein [Casimicrobiaceae bacterium]|nr:phage holin family protein [Casimicrobiaceae bacterium]